MIIPNYASTFSTGTPSDQLHAIGRIVATHEGQLTAWLLCHPATVDRLCNSLGLPRGTVTAGVRAIIASARQLNS